jgi:hypothetical protein
MGFSTLAEACSGADCGVVSLSMPTRVPATEPTREYVAQMSNLRGDPARHLAANQGGFHEDNRCNSVGSKRSVER